MNKLRFKTDLNEVELKYKQYQLLYQFLMK